MPYDLTQKVIYGTDANTPETWARKTFCDWLAAKLNDPAGPYAAALGITEERQAWVGENPEIARAMYRRADAPPVISIRQGPSSGTDLWKKIDGFPYRGRRLDVECSLGMGVADRTPKNDDLAAERTDDNNIAGFVTDAINQGFNELTFMGLCNMNVEPDPEANVRHPQKLTFFLKTLRDWTP